MILKSVQFATMDAERKTRIVTETHQNLEAGLFRVVLQDLIWHKRECALLHAEIHGAKLQAIYALSKSSKVDKFTWDKNLYRILPTSKLLCKNE